MNASLAPSGFVRVDGAKLRYAVEGAGTPVLVIGSSIYYPRTFARQLRQSLRLASIDVRHFGERDRSSASNAITLDTYANDIELLRAKLGMERVVLVGHSHHGNLALEYAKRYPEAVTHLVLIGSPPCDVETTIRVANAYWDAHASDTRKAARRERWRKLTPERLDAMSPEERIVAEYVADGPKYWFDEHYDASWLWRGMPMNALLIARFRDFFMDYRLSWDAHQMTAPVLVITGRHDYVVPFTLWNDAAATLPSFSSHLFERSGHTPQLEEPELFNRVLLDWIRNV
jgi:proline iminopeptidase